MLHPVCHRTPSPACTGVLTALSKSTCAYNLESRGPLLRSTALVFGEEVSLSVLPVPAHESKRQGSTSLSVFPHPPGGCSVVSEPTVDYLQTAKSSSYLHTHKLTLT